MATFVLTVRLQGKDTPIKETVSARHQSEARLKVEAMYKGCNIVSCVQQK